MLLQKCAQQESFQIIHFSYYHCGMYIIYHSTSYSHTKKLTPNFHYIENGKLSYTAH